MTITASQLVSLLPTPLPFTPSLNSTECSLKSMSHYMTPLPKTFQKILGVKPITLSKAHPALQDWPLPDPLTSSPASLLSHSTALAFFPFFLMLGVFPLPGTYPCTLFPNLIQDSVSLISSLQASFLTIPSPGRKRELSCPTVYTQVRG